jgi:hypothetical protein
MPLESILSRARYVAIVLPLFALFSTAHAGCNLAPNGNYYGNYRSSASASTTECVRYGVTYDAQGNAKGDAAIGPCDQDDGDDEYESSSPPDERAR